ncbi:hypothetical protein NCS57_00828900 [Fusarium keratoplasticum]|uniref:Uncharacterized protein n=1 Tax=Fusarium keratoplasticum TaxID=1328300 RepID=A0ACC0QT99_9HYPO|nr:hypothetical protein NCS57_00828900 [Fusarium keratoplasticum]KAI8666054.1 hypothetical protein NCS57_00828900 [Fusarium keratoplasticum]KAI8667761.1 hypothetical protein NCS55_00798900 [Fusarium keratoplasticum]
MRPFTLPSALFVAAALAQKSKNVECADGLYMVVARGTGEEKGVGITGEVAEDVADRVKGSIVEPLDYPATFLDPAYDESEAAGVEAMTKLLTNYHSSCPDGKIAVFGYSQGGQVATDTFCGGSGGSFPDNKPISTDLVEDSVVAIIIFGDPSHVANASYNQGTGEKNGVFARTNITLCEDQYTQTGIIRSYCDTGDTYCDRGSDEDVHGEYVSKYGDEVVEYVVDQYEKAVREGTKSTSTATATGTSTEASTGTATGTETGTASTASETESAATSTPTATAAPGNGAAGLAPGLALAAVPVFLAISELLF